MKQYYKKILFLFTILLYLSCSSSIERKETIWNNTLRIYEEVDLLLINPQLTEKQFDEQIKLKAMKRAYKILKEYFIKNTRKQIQSKREIKLFQDILREPKLYIIEETEASIKLFADFNIKLLHDYFNERKKNESK